MSPLDLGPDAAAMTVEADLGQALDDSRWPGERAPPTGLEPVTLRARTRARATWTRRSRGCTPPRSGSRHADRCPETDRAPGRCSRSRRAGRRGTVGAARVEPGSASHHRPVLQRPVVDLGPRAGMSLVSRLAGLRGREERTHRTRTPTAAGRGGPPPGPWPRPARAFSSSRPRVSAHADVEGVPRPGQGRQARSHRGSDQPVPGSLLRLRSISSGPCRSGHATARAGRTSRSRRGCRRPTR